MRHGAESNMTHMPCRFDGVPDGNGWYTVGFKATIAGVYRLQLVIDGDAVPTAAYGNTSLSLQVACLWPCFYFGSLYSAHALLLF